MTTEVYSLDEAGPSEVTGGVRNSTRSAWVTMSDFGYVGGLGAALLYRLNYQSRLNVNNVGEAGNSILAGTGGGGGLAFPNESSSSSSSGGAPVDKVFWVRASRGMQIFDWTGTAYKVRFGLRTQLSYDGGNDEFTLIRQNGAKAVFYGLSGGTVGEGNPPVGALKSVLAPGGGETDASYGAGRLTQLRRSTGSGENLDAATLLFDYDGNGRRSEVRHELTRGGATSQVRRVTYAYYGAGENGGSEGDLKTTLVESRINGRWVERGRRYLRYYESNGGDGFVNGLRYFLGPGMYQTMERKLGTPEEQSDEDVEIFANLAIKYDPTSKRVKEIRRKGI